MRFLFKSGYQALVGLFAERFMKILFTLLALCFALNAHAATYMLLSQTNAFAAGITNEAKAYADTKAPLASPALTGTPTINGQSIETQLTNKVEKAGDTMSGALVAPAFDFPSPVTLTPEDAGTLIDFGAVTRWASCTLTGNVLFTTANISIGKTYNLLIRNTQSTNCLVTFPWPTMLGGIVTNINALTTNRLSVECWGTTTNDIVSAIRSQ